VNSTETKSQDFVLRILVDERSILKNQGQLLLKVHICGLCNTSYYSKSFSGVGSN